MCCEKLLIYARCAHPKSSMGTVYHCPSYLSRGRTCVNNQGHTFKGYDYIIEDNRTQRFLDGREYPVLGGWKAEIALDYKGFCPNCVEGSSEPLNKRQREDFLDVYLGDHERWETERENREKLIAEQERLMERLKKEKRESEAWTEAD
jgi:hypothetical protein